MLNNLFPGKHKQGCEMLIGGMRESKDLGYFQTPKRSGKEVWRLGDHQVFKEKTPLPFL